MLNSNVEALIGLFVKREKRERILTLAGSEKRAADFRGALLHDPRSFDAAVLHRLVENTVSVATIAKSLRSAGAGERACCISEILEADEREMDLAEALDLVVGRSEDSLVFPIGSSVAYYENHEGEQYLLQRKTKP